MSVRTPHTASPGPPGDPPGEPPYPWRLFIGMLLAIIVGGAVLAVALGLNPLTLQRSGPAVQATPATAAPPVATLPAPAATATPAIISTPASGPASTAVPTAQGGGAPAAVQTPVVVSTSQATASAATGPRTGGTPAPTEAVIPTAEAQPTPVQAAVPPELAAAIINGYDKYWSVRVQAMGDPGNTAIDLESVMAGDELAIARKTLAEYRNDGEAFRTTVKHQIWITRATSDEAEVVDQYTATTLKVDPETKEPVEPQPEVEQLSGRFVLQALDGAWKVVTESYQ
jgi:hypothetical protein